MERLTEKHYLAEDHYMKCSEDCNVDMDCVDCPAFDKLIERLAAYEDTGLTPEEVLPKDKADEIALKLMRLADLERLCSYERLRELAEADKDGRVVVLPCKVGERWADEDGRAVRITAVIVSIEPFGTNINIYFDYEDATPDDAGSDCVTNWDYFSRHYTCIEAERATEGATE